MVLIGAVTIQRITGRSRISLFRKSIPKETVARGVSLVLLSLFVVTLVFFLVLATETPIRAPGEMKHDRFLVLLFETVSAFGTVGLSMGATPGLGTIGKLLVIFMMLLGRVGLLTFAYGIVGSRFKQDLEYSEQNIMIG
jgi:trk system potassium uptake protein TrkH